jgi:hypothetical protein
VHHICSDIRRRARWRGNTLVDNVVGRQHKLARENGDQGGERDQLCDSNTITNTITITVAKPKP